MLIEANKNDLDIANTIYTLTNNNYELVSHSHSAKKDFSQKEEFVKKFIKKLFSFLK